MFPTLKTKISPHLNSSKTAKYNKLRLFQIIPNYFVNVCFCLSFKFYDFRINGWSIRSNGINMSVIASFIIFLRLASQVPPQLYNQTPHNKNAQHTKTFLTKLPYNASPFKICSIEIKLKVMSFFHVRGSVHTIDITTLLRQVMQTF